MAKWYALFSHTGSEILNIQEQLGIKPEKIITSNKQYQGPLPAQYMTRNEAEIFLSDQVEPGSIVTLNGYRRLISARVLQMLATKNVNIVNIHPAPVFMEGYEDLRGIDPHKRYYEGVQSGKYTRAGVTLHKVDAGVDTGEVVYSITTSVLPNISYDDFVGLLHELGTTAWCRYLPQVIATNKTVPIEQVIGGFFHGKNSKANSTKYATRQDSKTNT